MYQSRKQIFSCIAALLLIYAQLGALVHAADHLFHEHDETCSAFISVEKHNATVIIDSIHERVLHNAVDENTLSTSSFFSYTFNPHNPRAPPYKS